MNNRQILFATLIMLTSMTGAQTKDGGISAEMLREMRTPQTESPAQKAIVNAMANNSIDNLAKSAVNAKAIDTQFSIETPNQSIANQQQSGRCWMFSGFNVLRADFARRTDSLKVDFSHAYLFFYDQLEKANLFLQGVIDHADKPIDHERVRFFFKSPLNDGGTFCGVADLADKYGLVPKELMPETVASDNTSRMSQLVKSKLREYGLQLRQMVADGKSAKDIQREKTMMLKTVWRMLALTIGEPPTQFDYAFKNSKGKTVTESKTYTPQSFYKEVVGKPLKDGYIMVMNDPRRPFYKTYEVDYSRHTYDGTNWKYLNLPMEDIEKMAIATLKDGKKLYSSYDVAKMLDRQRGYADIENFDYGSLFGTTFGMDKAQRIATFDSGSTHAMTLTAVDLDKNGKAIKWKVENSWGAAWAEQAGYLIMSDRWFREYMFRLVVDKRYAPTEILKMSEQKALLVMPEDPLFLNDN